jgi:hypothetical protein
MREKIIIAHSIEVNEKHDFSFKYLICGGITGLVEHSCMFPIDTIKTR